jgi:hypothetical protein
MDLSPAAFILVHVIGIVAVFAMGYQLGQRKTERPVRRPSTRLGRPKQVSTQIPAEPRP